jgi:hypothetical protein
MDVKNYPDMPKPPKDEVWAVYEKLGGLKATGVHYGVSYVTVRNWFLEYGIPRNPPGRPTVDEVARRKFGGKQEGAGRPALPRELKRRRIVIYVEPAVAEWIAANGGMKFAAQLLAHCCNINVCVLK